MVTLLRQAFEEEGFVIFWAMDEEGLVDMELAARFEWCHSDEKLTHATRFKKVCKNLWHKRHSIIRPKVLRLLSRK
jgi:hypothetical protein